MSEVEYVLDMLAEAGDDYQELAHVSIFIQDLLDDEDTEDIKVRDSLIEIRDEVDTRLTEFVDWAAWNQVNDFAAARGEQFPDDEGGEIHGEGEGLIEE